MQKKLDDTHRQLLDLRFKAATKQIKNHREIPQARRDIARIKTAQRERELGIRQD
jgi:large subunit ribosomal protein L29